MLDTTGSKYYRLKEVAAGLGLNRQTVCKYHRAGKLHPIRIGGLLFFHSHDLDKFLRGKNGDSNKDIKDPRPIVDGSSIEDDINDDLYPL